VRIKDTGIGIAPQDISVALTPFGQIGDPSQNCLEGTGLGLPLSKKIIELHDGTFRIASTVGQGTEITLVLPPYRLRHKNTPQTPPSKQPQTIGTPEAMH
jgi:signal transduction histidine kinase